MNNNDLTQWGNRIEVGKAGEAVWEDFCTTGSLIYEEVGYEFTTSTEEIVELKKRNDWEAKMIRHYPDFKVNNTLVQVKTAPQQPTDKYKAVTIEQDSFFVSRDISQSGSPVLLVYVYGDGSMWGNWITEVHSKEPYRQSGAGSGTPYRLIDKKYLKPIDEFVDVLSGVNHG